MALTGISIVGGGIGLIGLAMGALRLRREAAIDKATKEIHWISSPLAVKGIFETAEVDKLIIVGFDTRQGTLPLKAKYWKISERVSYYEPPMYIGKNIQAPIFGGTWTKLNLLASGVKLGDVPFEYGLTSNLKIFPMEEPVDRWFTVAETRELLRNRYTVDPSYIEMKMPLMSVGEQDWQRIFMLSRLDSSRQKIIVTAIGNDLNGMIDYCLPYLV